MANRTVYDVRYTAAKLNRRKCRVWNSRGHVTTLPWLFQKRTAERYILRHKCLKKWIGSVVLGTRWFNFQLLEYLGPIIEILKLIMLDSVRFLCVHKVFITQYSMLLYALWF